jgi:hypothetical protein
VGEAAGLYALVAPDGVMVKVTRDPNEFRGAVTEDILFRMLFAKLNEMYQSGKEPHEAFLAIEKEAAELRSKYQLQKLR